MVMTFKLPERRHLVHKPIEPRNLSAKLKSRDIAVDADWMWQLKYDGCNLIVVVCDGKGYAFTRTGEQVFSCDHIVRELEMMPHYNQVWFGEAYCHDWNHSRINGSFRSHAPAPDLCFMVFDSVPLACFEAGECDITYEARFNWVERQLQKYGGHHCRPVHTFAPSRLTSTEDLIDTVRKTQPYELDGYVAKRKDGLWVAGAGKGGEQIKVKDHLSLDLKCVGLVEGKGKFEGMVGAIKVEYNGQVILVGGGKMITMDRGFIWNEPSLIVGKIVEVHALASSQHGLLREPRFIRIRHDKTEPDA